MDILPTSWGQLAFMFAVVLLMETRHYAPILRDAFSRWLNAKVAQEEKKAGILPSTELKIVGGTDDKPTAHVEQEGEIE